MHVDDTIKIKFDKVKDFSLGTWILSAQLLHNVYGISAPDSPVPFKLIKYGKEKNCLTVWASDKGVKLSLSWEFRLLAPILKYLILREGVPPPHWATYASSTLPKSS